MTSLRQEAEKYVAMRRALGYKLVDLEHLLMQFITYLERRGDTTVTIDAAVTWARQPQGADPNWWRYRLSVTRSFARHLHTLDPAAEVPPTSLLRCFRKRTPPHLYSDQEVRTLQQAADGFPDPLRAATYRTLIGLLAVTGLRPGEAVRLDRDDADLDRGVLTVRRTKFDKSRQVLLHPTAVDALRDYGQVREGTVGSLGAPAFFVSARGRLLINTIDYTFAYLVKVAGIRVLPGSRSPRLLDFRHTFAVSTMLDWYRDGADVQERLPLLATWLGHVSPTSTYWYLQASPELLALAAYRLEHPIGASR